MRPRRVVAVLGFLVIAGGLVGSAAGQGLSPITEQTEALFAIVLLLALLVGLVVYGTLAIALIRFRASRSAGTANPSHGNRALETAWSAVPALLLVGLTVISTQTLLFIEANPANALEIRVVGQQWSWSFEYPDGRTSNELWLERGATFVFNVTSVDVIHSFYLPEFQIKIDAVKGMYNHIWLRPDVAGRFHTQCAEYCGLLHSGMVAEVVVFEPQPGRPPYGPPPGAPRMPTLVDITIEELGPSSFALVPSTLNFTVNDYVQLRISNNGSAGHIFTIDEPYNVSTGSIPPASFRLLFLNLTSVTNATLYGGDSADRANGLVGTLVVAGGTIIDINLIGSATQQPFRIEPAEIRVPLGETVIFRVHNLGDPDPADPDPDHNFTLLAPYQNVKWDQPIGPGETVTLGPVTLDKEARATYICAIPGHADVSARTGMIGTLIVGNPPEEGQAVTYPLLDFALATFAIGGIAGFGYVVHHAREGARRPERERKR